MKSFRSQLALATMASLGFTIGCSPNVILGHDDPSSGGSGGSAGADSTSSGPATGGNGSGGDGSGGAGTGGAGASSPEALLHGCRIQSLAEDDDTLYFYYSRFSECDGSGHIARIAKTGGAPQMLADIGSLPSTAVDTPVTLEVDDADVFWTASSGSVNKVSKQGGAVVALETGGQALGGLRLFGGDVYFVDMGHVETAPPYLPIEGAIEKVSKQGGAITTLVGGLTQAGWLAVDATGVFFSAAPQPDQDVYAGVYRMGHGGGATELISETMWTSGVVLQLDLDGSDLFYTTTNVSTVWTAPTSLVQPPLPNAPTEMGSTLPNVQHFIFDADNVYASCSTTGTRTAASSASRAPAARPPRSSTRWAATSSGSWSTRSTSTGSSAKRP